MSDLITNSLNTLAAGNTYNTSSATNGLESTLSSTDLKTASDEKLLAVCKDFESYFVEQVFKAMEKMVPKDKDDSESSSNSGLTDYFKDELVSKYASSASDSNGGKGFGIAQMLYEQMKRNYSSSDTE